MRLMALVSLYRVCPRDGGLLIIDPGKGTRMCAGFHLANRQLYVMMLRLLWSFKIELSEHAQDNGWQMRALEVMHASSQTLLSTDALQDVTEPWHLAAIPPDFKVRFVPRRPEVFNGILKC